MHLERKRGVGGKIHGKKLKGLTVSKNGPLKPSQVTAATSPVLKDAAHAFLEVQPRLRPWPRMVSGALILSGLEGTAIV